MFIQTQQWNFLNAVYFCFITLSTIGFGDYVPKTKENEEIGLTEEQTELVGFKHKYFLIIDILPGEYCHYLCLHDLSAFSLLHDLSSCPGKLVIY